MGPSIDACRFSCHSAEKSGFCCAIIVMVPTRATTAAMKVLLGIVSVPGTTLPPSVETLRDERVRQLRLVFPGQGAGADWPRTFLKAVALASLMPPANARMHTCAADWR